ncbi:DNA repair protein RecN [Rhodococcus sp. IEGM 1408]|uniref:DNA repair protein RecN n=1 Tax=Rhodococcus sp. IEGM 1408 TaxID=3082220 RepID=UPI0029556DB1|nr:DNA repair protein RecN [Rhodococcus sp. IEGM 1408]MDV8002665.1 DNA repair protein RecN [Rhodococcus sp. IEGM 1408]
MLTELRISGLGVIDEAVADFAPGLSVLTGETGAGKTMVVTGLRLLAGGRADPGRVRRGADKAVVEGRFDLAAAATMDVADRRELDELLEDADVELDEDGSVIAARRVGADGRSRARLGGRSVPAGTLARFCAPVLAVHGQNDQLRLLKPDRQREAVDSHGGAAARAALDAYREVFHKWREARRILAERTGRARELAREADMLRLGLEEIDALDPKPGEEAELDAVIRRLTDSEELREVAGQAHEALTGDAESAEPVVNVLDHLRHRLAAAGDPALDPIATSIGQAVAALGDAATELGRYLADLPVDAADLDSALERRHDLKALTRKYGTDVDDVIEWARTARVRLSEVDTSDAAVAELTAAAERLATELADRGAALTAVRRAAGDDLAGRVSAELAELSMGGIGLVVRVRASGDGLAAATESGLDDVELALDGPSGVVPLGKGASGGELSRVMLALEVVLAERSGGGTLVFDEVDAGVGGRAALSIGKRLAILARTHQVIAVTHLAQVAAYADTHLVVNKSGDSAGGAGVVSGVRSVDDAGRVTELARMLAGMEDTDTGLAHAEELLTKARAEKSQAQVDR